MSRTVLGWTEAGGAVLIDTFDDGACDPKRRLEIWHVGATQPAACYDLFGDPEKRIACDNLSVGTSGQKPKSSTVVKRFSKAPVQLDPSKVRVKQHRSKEEDDTLRVTVEIETAGTWRRAWTGTIAKRAEAIDAKVWPNARGDRALMLVDYVSLGAQAIDVHWVDLP